jgi:ketosteroid isomerase-like protein
MSADERTQALHDAFNRGDRVAVNAFWAPDIEYEAPGISLRGSEARALAETAAMEAFGNLRVDCERRLVIGSHVVEENVITGVHSGPLSLGTALLPATGRTVSIRCVYLYEWRDGLVIRQRAAFDRLALVEQLGVR